VSAGWVFAWPISLTKHVRHDRLVPMVRIRSAARRRPPPPGTTDDPEQRGAGGSAPGSHWVRPLVSLLGILVVFYAVPIGGLAWETATVVAVLVTLLGVVLLGWAIAGQVRRQLLGGTEVRVDILLTLLGLVAVVFAFGYLLLEDASPGQFVGLQTRTDALYFTLSTLATVGFGDVHAQGQVARAMVSTQIVFDVVFVAALVATLTGRLRYRAAERAESRKTAAGNTGPDPTAGPEANQATP
jgi:voltage-gated potassium channel